MKSKEIFLICFFVFLFFLIISVFATAFDGSGIDFKEFYLYDAAGEKTPKNVFFVGEGGESPAIYGELTESASKIVITLMDAETRIPNQSYSLSGTTINQKFSFVGTPNFSGNYAVRVTAENLSGETIREIFFTTIPKETQINIPESNELMVLALFLAVTGIITKKQAKTAGLKH